MKDSFKKKMWISMSIIIVAVVAATGAVYFFSNDLNAKANKIILDESLIAQQNNAAGVLSELKSDAPVAAQYSTAMNQLLPTHDSLIGFPSWLDTVASAHNVSVAFTFTGNNVPASASAAGTDGFTLSVTGAASDIASFLGDIETQSQNFLLNIDSFTMQVTNGNYQLSAQGELFSRQ